MRISRLIVLVILAIRCAFYIQVYTWDWMRLAFFVTASKPEELESCVRMKIKNKAGCNLPSSSLSLGPRHWQLVHLSFFLRSQHIMRTAQSETKCWSIKSLWIFLLRRFKVTVHPSVRSFVMLSHWQRKDPLSSSYDGKCTAANTAGRTKTRSNLR